MKTILRKLGLLRDADPLNPIWDITLPVQILCAVIISGGLYRMATQELPARLLDVSVTLSGRLELVLLTAAIGLVLGYIIFKRER